MVREWTPMQCIIMLPFHAVPADWLRCTRRSSSRARRDARLLHDESPPTVPT